MELALALVWWSSVVIGAVALLVGTLSAKLRRSALISAAGAFFIAGVLGILSIGFLLLILAALCALAARTARP